MSVVDMWLEDYCKERLIQHKLKLPVTFSFITKGKALSQEQITCSHTQEMVTAYLACHHYPGSQTVVIIKNDGTTIEI